MVSWRRIAVVSSCWWWFVVVPCSPALCPSVLCLRVALRCLALRSLFLCCLFLFALACLKNHCKTQFFTKISFLVFSCFLSLFKIKQNELYTTQLTREQEDHVRASTCMLPAVGDGLQLLLAAVLSCRRWSCVQGVDRLSPRAGRLT